MFADTTYTTGQGRCQRREPHELAATWRAMTGSSGGRGPGGEGDRAHGHGRHGGHRQRGFGPGGGYGGFPFGGTGGGGPFGRGRGRKARRGDIRTAALLLLAEEPRNGYQIMQEVQERSGGVWSPSPGSVYPALAQLEDEGLIHSVDTEGESGRAFELTDKGREQLAERGEQKPPWEPEQDDEGNPRFEFRHSIGGLVRTAAHVFQDGTPEQVDEALKILEEAKRQLYRLLAGDE